MSTTTPNSKPTDFASLNDAFTALIDSVIPAGFGKKSKASSSLYPVESADAIIERNRNARKAEKHRKIISGDAEPKIIASASTSTSTQPLANALKRKLESTSTPNGSSTNGTASTEKPNGIVIQDSSDEEEESRSRIVTKKTKMAGRDAFATKKQKSKGKTVDKPNGTVHKQEKIDLVEVEPNHTQEALPTSDTVEIVLNGHASTTPSTIGTPTSTQINPFRLTPSASSSNNFKPLFSSNDDSSVTPSIEESQKLATESLPERERTGMTPPAELHGKQRKRWKKQQKKKLAGQRVDDEPDSDA